MLDVARRPDCEASWCSGSCSAWASRRTGPARPRRWLNGFRAARAAGRSRSSTAARRSAPRSRRSSCSAVYRLTRQLAPGVHRHRAARLPVDSAVSAGCIDRPRIIRGCRLKSALTSWRTARRHGAGDGGSAGRPLDYATLLSLAANLGHRHRQGADRSGLVLHHRLVRDLPREPRVQRSRTACSRSGCRLSPRTSATSPAAAYRAFSSRAAGESARRGSW